MFKLSGLLLIVLAAFACTPNTSTVGQHITCETDANGAVVSCQPGGGSGGANTCEDVDEDGDGMPGDHDDGDEADDDGANGSAMHGAADDEDDDGISNADDDDDDSDGIDDSHDCDEHAGGDSDDDA